uniref:Putative secreted protein n=1 Tax=Amblyomma parvum TaxID=251391 RepID=A0A023FVQ0_AMBPA
MRTLVFYLGILLALAVIASGGRSRSRIQSSGGCTFHNRDYRNGTEHVEKSPCVHVYCLNGEAIVSNCTTKPRPYDPEGDRYDGKFPHCCPEDGSTEIVGNKS